MLAQRQRRWASIETAACQTPVCAMTLILLSVFVPQDVFNFICVPHISRDSNYNLSGFFSPVIPSHNDLPRHYQIAVRKI